MTAIARVLEALRIAKCDPNARARAKGTWRARCPLHRDEGYYLTIAPGAGDLVDVSCEKGCDVGAIARTAGLTVEDLLPGVDDRPPEFSDDALALRFTAQYRDEYRFTATLGKWRRWKVSVWRDEETLAVFDCVRCVLRSAAAECTKANVASSITSSRTVNAVEKLARADRAHAATHTQWDADPWLLNTPAGVVDLRTGTIRPAAPADYITKVTSAAPADGEPALWLTFLDRVTGGDVELQGFLQRVAGYCLTGSTKAHALFFLYGTGGNGKGTFVETLAGLLQDYARTAPIETFTASRFDRHPTELAMLKGARLVNSQETEKGRRWAEARIKSLTGGDTVTARFMRMDYFEFKPEFKLLIAGNHKPQLSTVDEAMRRRFHLIPFTQNIRADERNEDLGEQLRAEFPRILGWAIAGCVAWQRGGLQPPAIVRDATEEYFEAEDSFQAWLDESCEVRPGHKATSAELFQSWRKWAEEAGEAPGSSKSFSEQLSSKGFARITIGHAKTRGFAGLRVLDISITGRSRDVA